MVVVGWFLTSGEKNDMMKKDPITINHYPDKEYKNYKGFPVTCHGLAGKCQTEFTVMLPIEIIKRQCHLGTLDTFNCPNCGRYHRIVKDGNTYSVLMG